VFAKGKSWHTPFFVLFYLESAQTNVGYVASKKVGNAVARNFAKRRLRALYNQYEYKMAGIYILVAKHELLQANFQNVSALYQTSLKRLKLN
jgi:ribonuclease P protein component